MIQILGLRDDVVEGCYYVEKRPRIAIAYIPRPQQESDGIYVCKLPIDLGV